jgi:peptidoglycan/LPS O-acetylase OafA/YrhL
MKKLDQLTFTRFLAALAVVFFHSGPVFPVDNFPFNPLFTSGQTAVSYFYVLSGFVMSLTYFRPGERFNFREYFKARFSRIYPVYLLSFVLTCLFYIDIMATVKTDKVLANLFLLQAWNPVYALSFNIAAWSLSVEAFFYLIFPLLALWAYRISMRRLIWLSIGFWVISQILHAGLYRIYYPAQHNLLLYFPPFHLNSFLLGAVGGAWYLTKPKDQDAERSQPRWLLTLSLFLIGLLLVGRELLAIIPESFSLDVGLLAPFFLVIVLALALDHTSLARRLSHPWLVLLGDASYALFILHIPIRWIGERWAAAMNMPYSIFIYIYWVLMIPLSVFVFLRFERPTRDWLRRNFDILPIMLIDALIILGAVYLGFALQLGTGNGLRPYEDALRFMARVALPAYGLALILVRLYSPAGRNTYKQLLAKVLIATMLGGAVITGLMLLGVRMGWVDVYSGTALLISALFIAALTFTVRATLRHKQVNSQN